MLDGVLFDFNGTLLQDTPYHIKAFARIAREEGIPLADIYSFAMEAFAMSCEEEHHREEGCCCGHEGCGCHHE